MSDEREEGEEAEGPWVGVTFPAEEDTWKKKTLGEC